MSGIQPNSDLGDLRSDIGLRYEAADRETIQRGMIGFAVAPVVEAPRAKGTYKFQSLKDVLPTPTDTRRTARGGYNRIGTGFDEKPYGVEYHGLEFPIDAYEDAEWRELIDMEDVGASMTRHQVIEGHERDVVGKVEATDVDKTLAGGDQWHLDTAPIVQLFAQLKLTFRLQTGHNPTSLLLDSAVMDAMLRNASVLEAVVRNGSTSIRENLEFANQNGQLRRDALAIALGLNDVVASEAVINTAEKPLAASLATSFPLTKAVLFKKSFANNTLDPQWMATIHYSAVGSQIGTVFDEYPEPQTMARILRSRMDYKVQVVNEECAYVLDDVVDPAALQVA